MRWATAACERARQQYPKIVRISAPVETAERLDTAYQEAKELLAKHPDVKGFEGSSVVDVAGIGRAVREAAFQDKTCVMGTTLPSVAGEFLYDGAVDKIFGPSGFSVGERVERCHDRATASRASPASRGAFGAPGPRGALAA
jgi:simple sugar transport system substrate-binding protein